MATEKHTARVRRELKAVGVTRYGLMKLSTKFVPEVVGLDERIGGAVYGWTTGGSAILVATNRRIIFIDKKPFFTTSDELTYDIVSGVKIHTGGPFCTIVLRTRKNDYHLKYVNENCARNFVRYLEHRRIHPGMYDQATGHFTHNDEQEQQHPTKSRQASDSAGSFIRNHKSGILATVNNNKAHSSIVHYVVDERDNIYFVTTPDSRKIQYIANNPNVYLTVFELETEITVRIEGQASVENDPEKRTNVILELSKRKTAQYERFTQNVSEQQQQLVVVRVEPIRTELTNYRKR